MALKPAKIDSLTSLRAFAAGALVFYHQMPNIIGIPSKHEFANGVSFFFVLSGFILAMNYPKLKSRSETWRFFLSRFARLYPVHLFTFVLFGLTFAPLIFFDPTQRGLLTLNALLLQAWVPIRGCIFSMNSVSWSVSAEFFFYLCFPLLIISKRPGLTFAVILSVTVAAIFVTDYFVTNIDVGVWEFTPAEMMVNTPYFRVSEFACGIWFASLYRRGFLRNWAGTVLETITVAAVLLVAANTYTFGAMFMSPGDFLLGIWLNVTGSMLFFGFLILVMSYQAGLIGRFLQTRVMVFLGETSFALYMIHSIIITAVVMYNLFYDQPWFFRFGLTTAVAYVSSFLIWTFVEKPCRSWILKFWRPATSLQRQST